MIFEVFHDGALQFIDALEDAAANTLPGDLGEEALDHVEPGRRGRCEVQEARMCLSGIVVDDQMQLEFARVR